MYDSRYLNLKEAASHIGRTERWMRRHWSELALNGVKCYRVPKWAPKGRLMVETASLEKYLSDCRVASPSIKKSAKL